MARHFKIIISVAYDEATMPEDMNAHLEANAQRGIERGELLNDPNLEAIVEEYDVAVEETTAP
jgi:hypothetical protein